MKRGQNMEINIKGLKVEAVIGVLATEKVKPQPLLIDIAIKFNAAKSVKSDNLEDTIDYFTLSKLVKEKVQNSNFQLLEKLADFILKEITAINLVKAASVTIHKPEALSQFGAVVSVTSTTS